VALITTPSSTEVKKKSRAILILPGIRGLFKSELYLYLYGAGSPPLSPSSYEILIKLRADDIRVTSGPEVTSEDTTGYIAPLILNISIKCSDIGFGHLTKGKEPRIPNK
jgi:hypothetical protein